VALHGRQLPCHAVSRTSSFTPNDPNRPLTGVFYTRSPARPNPLGLHPVTVREIDGTRIKSVASRHSTALQWSTSSQRLRVRMDDGAVRILQFAIARVHVGYEALLMNDFPAQRCKLLALFRRQSCT
jgi:hypothetical protein